MPGYELLAAFIWAVHGDTSQPRRSFMFWLGREGDPDQKQ